MRVTAVGVCERTPQEIREKWSDVKIDYIKRNSDAKKTGGGKAAPSKIYDQTVERILGK